MIDPSGLEPCIIANSQRDQHERLERYCNQNQITISQVIFEDHSAKNFNRPDSYSFEWFCEGLLFN